MTQESGRHAVRFFGWGIVAVIVVPPTLLFLALISYGAFLFPVMGLLFLGIGFVLVAPWLLVHLVLSLVTAPLRVADALGKLKALPQRAQ